jgi:hypothetical protein
VLNDSTSDGVVVGDVAERSARRPLDPMAFPGIRSTEAVGLGANAGTIELGDVLATSSTTSATLDDLAVNNKLEVPLADSYSLRVNLSRRLFDNGIAVQGSPSLATLTAVSVLRLNHFDLDRLGVATGDVVGVNGPRGSVRLPVAIDDAVPRGVTEIAFGSLDVDGFDVVRPILDGGDVISQVRLEST